MTKTEQLARALERIIATSQVDMGLNAMSATGYAINEAKPILAKWEAEKASEQQAERLSESMAREAFEARRPNAFMWKRGGSAFAEDVPPTNYVDPGVQKDWQLWCSAWSIAETACAAKWGVNLSSQEGTGT